MLIRTTPEHPIPSSEITAEGVYQNRREFLREAGILGAGLAASSLVACAPSEAAVPPQQSTINGADLKPELTPEEDVTSYNNFYEFGTGKDDPKANAQRFRTKPWASGRGLVGRSRRPLTSRTIKPLSSRRIYRHRCVEAWSMVVPWLGFPMSDLINRVQPLGSARYVEFSTLLDPQQMPGQRFPVLDWPYVEGLRLDEAMNPLAMFVVGVYGKMLPNQNGAPLRHVVPWKYGFKGCKSIVKMRFTEKQPSTAWQVAAPDEYGFFANVNPEVDHPRWSQSRERRIGEIRRRPTLMFNGYADRVASLYSGMDLRRNY
jgi:sulfoxide reductase catalytic subunit YedY